MRDLGSHPLASLLTARIKFLEARLGALELEALSLTRERDFAATTLKEWNKSKSSSDQTPRPKKTIKQAVREVLTLYPDGLSADELVVKALEHIEITISPPSLPAQLQRMASDGEIKKAGKIWVPLKR